MPPPETSAGHDIVVIGGSAGAFGVIRALCRDLPNDLPAAVFVVLHLSPEHGDTLAGAIAAPGGLPVEMAADSPFETGRIYVAPAKHHLLVMGPQMRLGRGPRENMARPAIDPLFRSAAASFGPRAIGVVLSGYLNDGAAGLAAIKACGGLTVVQSPTDAKADSMPNGALQACDVDYRGAAQDLAGMLAQLVRTPPGPVKPIPAALALEIDIALGRPCDSHVLQAIGAPVAISCPSCGGVLSEVRADGPLRYRCQVGHAYTADVLEAQQEGAVDEALRLALRIVEERVTLLERMAENDRRTGRPRSATQMDMRVAEYRAHADVIRRSLAKVD
jgi:two-component system chemotaxis response regulator CheB